MSDDSRSVLALTVAVAASMALFATFLPWYSFDVVLPDAVGKLLSVHQRVARSQPGEIASESDHIRPTTREG